MKTTDNNTLHGFIMIDDREMKLNVFCMVLQDTNGIYLQSEDYPKAYIKTDTKQYLSYTEFVELYKQNEMLTQTLGILFNSALTETTPISTFKSYDKNAQNYLVALCLGILSRIDLGKPAITQKVRECVFKGLKTYRQDLINSPLSHLNAVKYNFSEKGHSHSF
jgi:hypothetical protein